MTVLKEKYDVVIVGSGFSGIVTADMLADRGLTILMVDENLHIGGQLLRKVPPELGRYHSYHLDYTKEIGFRFIDGVRQKKLTVLNKTLVLGIYPGKKILLEMEEKKVRTVGYGVILFATGARERFFPFKGWTLPGVISTGLLQVMMKSSGVLPAERVLIGGTGLFLFAAAYEFLKNRGKIPAILEQSTMMDKVKFLPLLLRQWPKLAEGARYVSKIMFSGVPIRFRRRIVEARGSRELRDVVVARVDQKGKVIQGTEKVYKTDCLALGYGFAPNIELPQLAGCRLEYSAGKGGWVVAVDDHMRTTVKNVYTAGETTGIGGAFKSINEGEIAAYAILGYFEKMNVDEFQRKIKQLVRQRKHHLKFAEYFNLLYRIPRDAWQEVADDTIICRCEDVTMGDIRQAVTGGYRTPAALKVATRTAMGNCQGRTCGPIIYDILAALTGETRQSLDPITVRPPVKPVSLAVLADL
jgi:NADPH-dependent 2,4-dienoyl-CoA reductase/sulfur reductase-like enzyme